MEDSELIQNSTSNAAETEKSGASSSSKKSAQDSNDSIETNESSDANLPEPSKKERRLENNPYSSLGDARKNFHKKVEILKNQLEGKANDEKKIDNVSQNEEHKLFEQVNKDQEASDQALGDSEEINNELAGITKEEAEVEDGDDDQDVEMADVNKEKPVNDMPEKESKGDKKGKSDTKTNNKDNSKIKPSSTAENDIENEMVAEEFNQIDQLEQKEVMKTVFNFIIIFIHAECWFIFFHT